MNESAPIVPDAAIGILGGGQLGRMLALAAKQMGYRVHVLTPDLDSPAGQVSDLEIVAAYYDHDKIRLFAAGVKVVTFEFENVPSDTAAAAAEETIVRPKHSVLHTTQNRLREKHFLKGIGVPVTSFFPVHSRQDIERALEEIAVAEHSNVRSGLAVASTVGRKDQKEPWAVVKTAVSGYDGKGQYTITADEDIDIAVKGLAGREGILEGFVTFEKEISVVGARGVDGSFAHWGAIENIHSRHILDLSVAPARIDASVAGDAVDLTRTILEALDVVGVLCVEMFLTPDGKLLVNELAPRPHNSGHLTIDACMTSQFEQQLRGVCGLPLGPTDFLRPAAAMANLLGDLWERGEPDWAAVCGIPGIKLHLYGKTDPRPGRKMGHLTSLAATQDEALAAVEDARKRLARAGPA